MPRALIKQYLDHAAFTPRHDTILVESLARLGTGRGRETLLEAALAAEDEVDANFYTNIAQIMRGYHETVAPLTDVKRVAGFVVAQASSGTLLVPFPLDHGAWTERLSTPGIAL